MPRVLAIFGIVLLCGAGIGAVEATQAPSLLNFPSAAARFWVRQAVDGAATRLQDPACQQIFDDFQDVAGNPLSATLHARDVTPKEYLTTWIRFVDGNNQPGCGDEYRRNAFTQPGSRVIFICGQRLLNATVPIVSADRDIVIIHEVLHTLGLGENPPTSAQITKQIAARCRR